VKSVIGLAILVAAHRGGAQLWPENSLLAFANALGLGVDAVETDVHLTADGEIVVIHDPKLDRTSTGRGRSLMEPPGLSRSHHRSEEPKNASSKPESTSKPIVRNVPHPTCGASEIA